MRLKPAVKPPLKPTVEPKPETFWLVHWRDPGAVEWLPVRHFLGPLSDGVLRRFLNRNGAEMCRDDLISAGKEAKAEQATSAAERAA